LLRCAELFANEAHITGLIPPGMYVYMSAFAFSANLHIATAVAEGKLRTKATIHMEGVITMDTYSFILLCFLFYSFQ